MFSLGIILWLPKPIKDPGAASRTLVEVCDVSVSVIVSDYSIDLAPKTKHALATYLIYHRVKAPRNSIGPLLFKSLGESE